MISVVMYGRNDSHGYNYHKRAAISINCIAENLSNRDDEIIFVDCNSPEEFPTLPQAIQDTLTEKAKKKIKIIRISNPKKSKFLSISESYSRNVAIQNSNPSNKWILSTNSDMIFIIKDSILSLSDVVENLEDGFYLLPRFAIPENLWEQAFDRSNPSQIMAFLRQNGELLQLHTTVRRPGFLTFDNPGDFQLMLRTDIIDIRGFDENMIRGWHVDANLCKRMQLHGRTAKSLENLMYAFHCNHNLKESLFSKKVSENCWSKYVANVTSPKLAKTNWGSCGDNIELIKLESRHLTSTLSLMSQFDDEPKEIFLNLENFNSFYCNPGSSFVHLADLLSNLPFCANISYFGFNYSTVDALSLYFEKMNFLGSIFYSKKFSNINKGNLKEFDEKKNIKEVHSFIFDFSLAHGIDVTSKISAQKKLREIFKIYRKIKKTCLRMNLSARFIGINVLHSDFYILFSKDLHLKKSDYSTGVTCGFLISNEKKPKLGILKKIEYLFALISFDYCDAMRRFLAKNTWTKNLLKSFQ
jgi:hypothetical protein